MLTPAITVQTAKTKDSADSMHAASGAQMKQIHHHEEQLTSICWGVKEQAELPEGFRPQSAARLVA